MSHSVQIVDFEKSMKEILEAYADDVGQGVKTDVYAAAKLGMKIVRENAPVLSGFYQKNISLKKVGETSTKIVMVIYVKGGVYRIAHLLEHGHRTRNGKKTKKIPHFAPAEKAIEEHLEKAVKIRVKGKESSF